VRRFDSAALHRAMDERRQALGLSWSEVARQTGVSAATLTRTKLGGRLEIDGVLAMVGWLRQPVERFVRESEE